jgi:hypothetical protein
VVEQCARSDRLNGFSEAHLVSEKSALVECKVQHAFALIGEERTARDLFRMAAIRNAGFVFAAAEDPVALARPGLEPRRHILGNPQGLAAGGPDLLDQLCGIQAFQLKPVAIETCAQAGRKLRCVALDAQAASGGVRNDVHA